jgi:hypothetical protein
MVAEETLIILGMGPTRSQCKYDCETWSVNTGYRQIAIEHGRVDRIFLAHDSQVRDHAGDLVFNIPEFNALADRGVIIYNTHRVKGLKARRYPLEAIQNRFGVNFFSDTIAYMIAYALYEGKWKTIKMYGVDMFDGGEYRQEKGGVEFWIGYGMGMGVKFIISEGASILQTVTGLPYGQRVPKTSDDDPMGVRSFKNTPAGRKAFARKFRVTTEEADRYLSQ